MKRLFVFSVTLLLVASLAPAKKTGEKEVRPFQRPITMTDNDAWRQLGNYSKALRAPAQLDTFYMLGPGGLDGDGTFEGGGIDCDDQGWTINDRTQQLDNYWHVDDFAELTGVHGGLVPLEGNQSMWCGARPDDTHPVKRCYVNLPGYADDWKQSLETRECLTVTGDVTIAFRLFWDSESNYDYTYIQWDGCDGGWQDLVPGGLDGTGQWDTTLTVPASSHSGNLRLRFYFQSDQGWSDGDGMLNSRPAPTP